MGQAAGFILQGFGQGAQIHGQLEQTKAQAAEALFQARVSKENAKLADWQARDALERGKLDESRHRASVKGLLGTQAAQFAASGVDVGSGSAVDTAADTRGLGELDALVIRSNAAKEAYASRVSAMRYRQEGSFLEAKGNALKRAGVLQFFGGHLMAAGQGVSSGMAARGK